MVGGLINERKTKSKNKKRSRARLKIAQIAMDWQLTEDEFLIYLSNLMCILAAENNKFIEQDYSDE